jgi:hypothetical protein
MRKVVFHYHLFKNAGTSIDEMLKANFGEHWVTREFPAAHGINQAQVMEWVRSEADAVAFSSHTALLPGPRAKGLQVFPILFVRHPIDRIASAYAFERKQGGDGFGAVLARNTTLAGYIEVRLSLPHDRQCRNFHCARLAQMFRADDGSERERAMRAVDAMPFVGMVEEYEESIRRLTQWLKPHFPQLTALVAARNVTRDLEVSLSERLAEVEAELGEEAFKATVAANSDDLNIFELVNSRFREPVSQK